MQCPHCRLTMHVRRIDAATVNECPDCGGIWFARGGLDRDAAADSTRWLDIDFWKNDDGFEARPESLGCPQCGASGLTRLIDRTTNTSLSLCSHCHGLWINPLQMEGIIRAVAFYADRSDDAGAIRDSLRQLIDMRASPSAGSISRWHDFSALLEMLAHRVYNEHPKLVGIVNGRDKTLAM